MPIPLSEEARRWRIAHGLPPEPVAAVANPFEQFLTARPQAATEPIRGEPRPGVDLPPERNLLTLFGEFLKAGGLPGGAKVRPPTPLKGVAEALPKLPQPLTSAALSAAMVVPAFAGTGVEGPLGKALGKLPKVPKKAIAAGVKTEMPGAAAKPVRTAKEIDEALGRFEATRPGDVPKPSIETEAQYVSRRIKEIKADVKSIGFALDETKQRTTLRNEYRATQPVAKAPSTVPLGGTRGGVPQGGIAPKAAKVTEPVTVVRGGTVAEMEAQMAAARKAQAVAPKVAGPTRVRVQVEMPAALRGAETRFAAQDIKTGQSISKELWTKFDNAEKANAFRQRLMTGNAQRTWAQLPDTERYALTLTREETGQLLDKLATRSRGEAVAPKAAAAAKVTEGTEELYIPSRARRLQLAQAEVQRIQEEAQKVAVVAPKAAAPVTPSAAVVPPSAARPVGPSVTSQTASLTTDQRIEAQIAAVRQARVGGVGVPPVKPPTATGGVPPVPEEPEAKLVRLLKEAKPVRKETELLKHKEMQIRAARVAAMQETKTGQEALFASLGQLKGELPQAAFEPPAALGFTKVEADALLDKIRTFPMPPLSKITPEAALNSLIFEGRLPTKGELVTMERIFGSDLIKALLDKRALGEKIWDASMDTIGLPKALVASADISAPMRQGLPLLTDPSGSWFKAWAPMLRAFAKDKWAIQAHEAIQSNPLFQKALEAGVDFTMFGAKGLRLTAHEERFMSRFTAKIPWVRMSERAYVTFLNKLRMDTFAYYARQLASQDAGPERYKAMAQFVNWATGRGTIPLRGERAAAVLNATFFAPRFVASRIELPTLLISRDPLVRKAAWRNMAGTVGVGLTTLGLMKLAGAEVELDPRSTDFGKGRFGGTRFDFWGGFQQYARYMTQLITAQRKTARGEITDAQRRDIAVRFLESKEGPIAGLITAMLEGKTFTGVKVAPTKEFAQQQLASFFVPMVMQDMYDAAKEHGLVGLAIAAPASTGVGVLTYESLSSNWRKDLAEFDAIPTNENEREAKGIKVTRTQYRERHPDVDAKLFILGEVTSLQTTSAAIKAAQLIRENQVDVAKIRGVQERTEGMKERQRLGLSPETDKTKVGVLLRMLETGQAQTSSLSGVPSAPSPSASTGGLSAEAKAWRVANGQTAEPVGAR